MASPDSVQTQIDRAGLTPAIIRILLLCIAITIADGFDLGAIAYVAPSLTQEWQLSSSELGALFGAGLFGLAVGALGLAPLADRFGRRPSIILATIGAGLSMVAGALAESTSQFLAARVVTGMGVGVLIPVLTTYVSEMSPSRWRNTSVALVVSIGAFGSVIGALVAAQFLEVIGWRTIFVGGGCVTLLLAVIAAATLPESPTFLVQADSGTLEKANAGLRRMSAQPLLELPARPVAAPRARILTLLSGELRHVTLMLWAIFIALNLFSYFMVSWTPQMLVDLGLTLQAGVYTGMVFPLGASTGAIVVAIFSRWWPLRRVVMASISVGCIAMAVLGELVRVELWRFVMMLNFASGFLVSGGFASVFTIAASYYQPVTRATALGWCMGVSRVGAVLGPALAGLVLDRGLAVYMTYWVFTLPVVGAVLLLAMLPPPRWR